MSVGIRAYNDGGQVIMSDETSSFYYYGTAEYQSQKTDTGYLGVRVMEFDTKTSKPIIPFIRPADASHAVSITRFYRGTNGYWWLQVCVVGADTTAPSVHVFTTADAENWDTRFPNRKRGNGLKVFRSNGDVAFDSTVGKPLIIRGGFQVVPPSNPTDGGTALSPTKFNEYDISGMTRPMFGYYSMAMSERQYDRTETSDKCTGIGYGGVCVGYSKVTVKYELWWAFYRSAIKITNTKLSCGWVTYSSGYYVKTESSSSLSFFIPIIPLGGGGGSYGSVPYVNSAINTSMAPVVLTDEALYT